MRCAGCAAAPCGEALQEMLPRRKKRPEDPGPRHRTPRSDNENMVKCVEGGIRMVVWVGLVCFVLGANLGFLVAGLMRMAKDEKDTSEKS